MFAWRVLRAYEPIVKIELAKIVFLNSDIDWALISHKWYVLYFLSVDVVLNRCCILVQVWITECNVYTNIVLSSPDMETLCRPITKGGGGVTFYVTQFRIICSDLSRLFYHVIALYINIHSQSYTWTCHLIVWLWLFEKTKLCIFLY